MSEYKKGQVIEFTTNDKSSICAGRITDLVDGDFGLEIYMKVFLEFHISKNCLEPIDVKAVSDGRNILERHFIIDTFPDQVVKYM
jgi:hypothetical protein